MSDLKALREKLREMRKESHATPISKMKKADIAAEIERLKVHRETTPAPAATPSAPMKKSMAAVESIKEAKEQEFPYKPETVAQQKKSTGRSTAAGHSAADEGTKKGMERKTARKAYEGETPSKKKALMAKMMKMMEDMSDSE